MAISAEEFIRKSNKEVEISGFDEGEKITVCLKKVSLTSMMVDGRIPNELLAAVDGLFSGKQTEKQKQQAAIDVVKNSNNEDLVEMMKLMNVVCEEAMVEPKFESVKAFLTDEQKNDIFTWVVSGVRDLTPIDGEPKCS